MKGRTGVSIGKGRTGGGPGVGKPGFCVICAWPGAQFINRRYANDPSAFDYGDFKAMAETMDPEWRVPSKPTWYRHKEHITAPLITEVEKARRNPAVVPKTSQGALAMIRDMGMQNAIERPETVTVDHAIKAAAELEKAKGGIRGVVMVLADMLGGAQTPAIDGTWEEVPQLESQEETNGATA